MDKTRRNDLLSGLAARLLHFGLEAEKPEIVIEGDANLLAVDVHSSPDVQLLYIDDQPGPLSDLVRAAVAQVRLFAVQFHVEDRVWQLERNAA
ncbi:hypothetical protein [Deinococcus deserti]|uniref:hypothetical protein n=1 Tax=Deinococcus deserti TaxID=310783 RepID=UPI0013924971|nr:hypothetical protein [Deinococcus deserti]